MDSADFDKDLSDIAAKFKDNVKLSDRSYRLKTYKQCFVGSEAVDYLVQSGATATREDAVLLGNAFIEMHMLATGRSDYPNQINNVLAFPGVIRGAVDCQAQAITTDMFLAAGGAIASLIPENKIAANNIMPSVFDERVAPAVAAAVKEVARNAGIARK